VGNSEFEQGRKQRPSVYWIFRPRCIKVPVMKHQTDTFTSGDGLSIFCQSWIPDSPTAVVVLSHGYAEHSGRYQHVVDALLNQNYAVYALDHRNHGQSDGEKGYVADFSKFIDDLQLFVGTVKSANPDVKMILLAHSMGAAIGTHYAIEHPDDFDLLVFSAPYLIDGGGVSPLLLKISGLMSTLLPRLPIKPLDSSNVSRDPAVVKDYDNDPLNSRNKIRARTGAELLSAGPKAFERASEIRQPILIMHGDADALASIDGSRKLNELISSDDKSLRSYAGLYHEILNEPEKDQVIADIIDWLRDRI
jgi:acylglycerol lipase